MANISASQVKELRQRTGAGMMDCKKALVEHDGDLDKAIEFLQIKGLSQAQKRAGREASEGVIGSYIHHDGKTGVLVEVNCETDFVARNDTFTNFGRQIAMHIAAARPLFVTVDEVPDTLRAKQQAIFEAQAAETGKPANIAVKIAEGRLNKWLKEICLLEQPFVMDSAKSVEEHRAATAALLGENLIIRRFSVIRVGEHAAN